LVAVVRCCPRGAVLLRGRRAAATVCRRPRSRSPSQTNLTRVSAYIFCYLIVGLGVPLFCIYARYNLAASRRVSPTVATLLGVAFPWAVSWMLYQAR
jgi:hypothetical protein